MRTTPAAAASSGWSCRRGMWRRRRRKAAWPRRPPRRPCRSRAGRRSASWWPTTAPSTGTWRRASCRRPATRSPSPRTATRPPPPPPGDFDLILMDLRMPRLDGIGATRWIRALPGPRGRVPIVALTAQAFAEQLEECRGAGMDGHLVKPFTMEGLLAAIAKGMAARRQGPPAPP
ncbi:response regulator [Paeniroseomonas aquatica]|uniref:response regulator n=1 Tax=Paeniroseomonas aquatica TaxID=373043 RepID=UPI00361C8C0F